MWPVTTGVPPGAAARPLGCCQEMGGGGGRNVVERPYAGGGGGVPPPLDPPPPPPLPMFEADSQSFASALQCQEDLRFNISGPPSVGTIGGL